MVSATDCVFQAAVLLMLCILNALLFCFREPPVEIKKLGVIKRLYGLVERLRPTSFSRRTVYGRYHSTSESLDTVSTYRPDVQNERKFAKHPQPEVRSELI